MCAACFADQHKPEVQLELIRTAVGGDAKIEWSQQPYQDPDHNAGDLARPVDQTYECCEGVRIQVRCKVLCADCGRIIFDCSD